MKYTITLFILLLKFTFSICQSVTITPGDTQAGIISNSTNNGIVPPRMNYSEILAIASPVEGTFVYDTEFKCLRVFNGSKWVCLNERLPAQNEPQGNFVGGEYGNSLPDHMYFYDNGSFPVSITVDNSGNIILIMSNTYKNPSRPNDQSNTIFLLKYNSTFNLIWSLNLGVFRNFELNSFSITSYVDSFNNIYLTGYDNGNFQFDDDLNPNSGMFLVKYSPNGVLQFIRRTIGSCNGQDIKVDSNGDIYLVGEYSNEVIFQSSPLSSLTSLSGSKDGFVAKYNSIGDIVWVISVGGIGNDKASKLGIAGTNLIVGGYFTNAASFGNSINKTSLGGSDIFLLKLSTSGSIAWVNSIGGTGAENLADLNVRDNGEVDLYGDIQGVLNFYGTPTTSISQRIGASIQTDLFLAQYFANGNIQTTPVLIGGPSSELATSMAMNSSGDLFLTGYVGENFTFSGKTLLAGGFILKYGSIEKWAVSGPQQKGVDICVNSNNQVFVTGQIFKTKNYFIGNYLTPVADRCYIWKYSE